MKDLLQMKTIITCPERLQSTFNQTEVRAQNVDYTYIKLVQVFDNRPEWISLGIGDLVKMVTHFADWRHVVHFDWIEVFSADVYIDRQLLKTKNHTDDR